MFGSVDKKQWFPRQVNSQDIIEVTNTFIIAYGSAEPFLKTGFGKSERLSHIAIGAIREVVNVTVRAEQVSDGINV
jgi:hypothetical protein